MKLKTKRDKVAKLPEERKAKLDTAKLRAKLPSIKRLRRREKPDNRLDQAIENLPRITNETVAEHREEMLSSARKFIYPLRHSRQYIVKFSVTLFVTGLIFFVVFVLVSLYRVQSTSTFVYGVTRVLPLPVAKAGDAWVSYESYLFELRHLMHYYETQQNVDFNSNNGKTQLDAFKKRAMDQVVTDAYVKKLAEQQNLSVNGHEVDEAVRLLREQNRLGNNDQEFADVLQEFWGWSVDDFRRALEQQLLAQKVVAALDTRTVERARQASDKLKAGVDFAKLAAEVSDDQNTKASGGEYGFLIDRSNRELAPRVVDTIFNLKPGQVSDIIDTGYALEIVKVIAVDNDKLRAAHIAFNYPPIGQFTREMQDKTPPHFYIRLVES